MWLDARGCHLVLAFTGRGCPRMRGKIQRTVVTARELSTQDSRDERFGRAFVFRPPELRTAAIAPVRSSLFRATRQWMPVGATRVPLRTRSDGKRTTIAPGATPARISISTSD